MCAVTKAGSSKCTHGSREPNNVNVLASVRQELIEKLAAASFRMLVGVLMGQMIPVPPGTMFLLRDGTGHSKDFSERQRSGAVV